jgi:long-chain acyl-CoA synthetase
MSSSENVRDVSWLLERLDGFSEQTALVAADGEVTYKQLLSLIDEFHGLISRSQLKASERVVLVGDFTPNSIAALFALTYCRLTLIPTTGLTEQQRDLIDRVCAPHWYLDSHSRQFARSGCEESHLEHINSNELSAEIRYRNTPGLILFTSGSSGLPKAVVHDFSLLLEKFRRESRPFRTLNFLLFDHWGGLNTLLHTLLSGGTIVCPTNRTPDYICSLIERYQIELLPASPSFLNLVLASGAHRRHDLSSLQLISYGAEPMPATTLERLSRELPRTELKQTYGLIELGVLQTKSESRDSLKVKIGGTGYEIRVVNQMLEIKARSSMLGYLNAPSPFTSDGYFKTGDLVEVDGEYLTILGRSSDLINVGGEKVFPAEVEAVLLECELVKDAVVYGTDNPLTGKTVSADVILMDGSLDTSRARLEIRKFCSERLARFKVPVKINFVTHELTTARQKRVRNRQNSEEAEDALR